MKTKAGGEQPPPIAELLPPAVVYVVDDDKSVRESLGNLMRSVGLKVELFESALEFRRFDRPPGPACLVLDVRLPGMSGLDLQSELIASGDVTPMVIITGHGDVPMSVRAIKGGALDFLQKPFREQDLLDAIHLGLAKSAECFRRRASDTGIASNRDMPLDGRSAKTFGSPGVSELSPRKILARNVQVGRAIFNWSQDDLGGRCELHRSHVSALEREEISVGVDALDRIAAAFSVEPHVLLMPPGEVQSLLLASLNTLASNPRKGKQ